MISIDWSGIVAFVVWFVWVAGTALPLTALLVDMALNGRPVLPVENRPEVTVAAA